MIPLGTPGGQALIGQGFYLKKPFAWVARASGLAIQASTINGGQGRLTYQEIAQPGTL